ncbi:hypothetical protein GCM10025876_28950 [Demequina litorisediminis]|uniref:Uncharacterized protein n=1 Tax=Demequina litorisediminis TaxID=1849022 RepID=A0ABQ6IHQ0_9MICO|nr:hypothetical protein GCM10025876_28950 [Demequina litorisediminis]
MLARATTSDDCSSAERNSLLHAGTKSLVGGLLRLTQGALCLVERGAGAVRVLACLLGGVLRLPHRILEPCHVGGDGLPVVAAHGNGEGQVVLWHHSTPWARPLGWRAQSAPE